MKIIIVTAYGGWGSTGKIADGIASTAKQANHEVWLAYGFFNSSFENCLKIKTGAKFSNFYEVFRTRITGYMGFTSNRATQKLKNWIINNNPDVINLHNLHGGYLHIEKLMEFLKSSGIPIIWTLHDCWSFTGHCAHFQIANCNRWKTGCFDCPDCKRKESYPISYFFDRSSEQYMRKKVAFSDVPNLTIVTPSQWLADLVKESFLKEYPVKVIHNGIDLEIFKPSPSDFREKHGIPAEKSMLLGVAFGWGKRKGLDVFVELARRLDPEKYQIVLVGTDEKTDKLLPENIISIHRTQNQAELAQIYTAADLFVNPTREEVLGLVNIEALACGTPVVTFNTGGSPECIDESCGSVVPCDDINALEREIIRICTEKPYSQADCLEHAKSFDMNERFQEYVDLYESITKKHES